MFNKLNSHLFYKYFLSYLLVFMVPYIAISIILFQVAVRNLENQMVQANIHQIEQVRDLVDTNLRELNDIATKISLDYRLTPYKVTQPYLDREAIHELVRYKMYSSMIDEIILHFHQHDEMIYTTKGSSYITTFIERNFQLDDDTIYQLNQAMKIAQEPTLQIVKSQSSTPSQYVFITYPLPVNSLSSYGSVTFIIHENNFSQFIEYVFDHYDIATYIFSEQQELIGMYGNGEFPDLTKVIEVAFEKNANKQPTIQHLHYTFSVVPSNVTGWTFVTVMPTEQFYKKMSTLKDSIILILVIIAIIGLVVVTFASFKQYKPLNLLVQFLRNNDWTKKIKKLDDIHSEIVSILEEKEQMKKELIAHKPFVQNQFLSNLLKGEINQAQLSIQTIQENFRELLQCKYVFVVAVSYKGKHEESFEQWDEMTKELCIVSFENCTGYGVELMTDDTIAFIVYSNDHTITEKQQRTFIQKLENELIEKNTIVPHIGVGKVYEGIQWINHSFIEAMTALENNLLNQQNHVVFYDNIVTEEWEVLWLPEERRIKLIQSLKQGDGEVAEKTLGEIFSFLRSKKSNSLLTYVCFDIINTIIKTSLELEIELNSEHIKELSKFTSLVELENVALLVIKEICQEVDQRKESRNYHLRDQIMEYIQQNYKDHTLSLDSIAEYFHISSPYLSRFIREQTGSTFTQFVWELRVKDVQHQLIHTNRPIKEIVQDVGYIDVSNFTRKFRTEVGMTPSQYRAYYQEKQKKKA